MRIYLYLLAGITSALIGWNIGQFFLTDIGLFKQAPEIVLFPCIAISIAIGMVMNEIFISTPTRPKLSFRIVRIPIIIATGLGLLAGLIAGGISQVLFLPQIPVPSPIVRMLGWLLIGSSVGIAEGLTWWWHSMEAGDPKRFRRRFKTSITAASAASLIAALLFELFRLLSRLMSDGVSDGFKSAEDPIGFSLLGLLLALVFSITNSPSYMAALRVGAGFEYTDEGLYFEDEDLSTTDKDDLYPRIDLGMLRFVSNSDTDEIEEGLSIQLPPTGKISIGGSEEEDHIYIPNLKPQVAALILDHRKTLLIPHSKFYRTIEVNNSRLDSPEKIFLKHNFFLTFYCSKKPEFDEPKIYRFVYYNRFLDPQA